MNFLELAKKRYSCRSYSEKKVEKEKLDLVLESGRVAPSGVNKQPQRLIVVQTEEGLEKIGKACRIYNAPLAIIVCGNKEEVWVSPYNQKSILDIDVSIVTDHMMLQATELGLDSLWVCWFDPEIIKNEFKIPKNLEPINILALGYGDKEAASSNRHDKLRKPLEETVIYESY